MSNESQELQGNKIDGMEVNSPTISIGNDRDVVTDSSQEKKTASDADPPADVADVEAAAKPEGPPNGGIRAWLQVVGAFVLLFNTWYRLEALDTVSSLLIRIAGV